MGTTNYDVIVIGLGPAGIMATLTLSQKGYRVLAIDRGKTYQMRDGFAITQSYLGSIIVPV